MESIKELYKIGPGPSSSHTIGPRNACLKFKQKYPNTKRYQVDLYGSLSLTGKGHFTDRICLLTLGADKCQVFFHNEFLKEHANILIISAFDESDILIEAWKVASVGGGSIEILNDEKRQSVSIYSLHSFDEISAYCRENNQDLCTYVYQVEPTLKPYLEIVFKAMCGAIECGLNKDGVLPGSLKFPRMAKKMYEEALASDDAIEVEKSLITAFAFSVAEENASMGEVVTAPTLGSSGVLPAVLYYYLKVKKCDYQKIIDALAVAGVFGNLVKYNATISGAEGGCQAEIGVACAMASAAVAFLNNLNLDQIGYAAEIGIEHNLGLTCDPVGGYVIIPCIERNGVAALRALDAAHYAKTIGKNKSNFVSFDTVVRTMRYTGKKIPMELKETSLGGLAREVKIAE